MKFIITVFCLLSFAFSAIAETKKMTLEDISIFSSKVPKEEYSIEFSEERVDRLEHHKKMGHITMGLMMASFLTAVLAKHEIEDARDKRGGVKSKDDANKLGIHMGISALTLASYFTTAYFSLSAPKEEGSEDESARKWHKGLAWVHGTAMVLAPILGYLAFKDYHDGKDPEGIAKLHKPIMMLGAASFVAAYSIAIYEW